MRDCAAPLVQPSHATTAADVVTALATTPSGLAPDEAAARLRTIGANRLPAPPRTGPLRRFMRQFHNVLIYALLAAAIVALAIGHGLDAGVIMAVVLVNALVGFVQEGRAEGALQALATMLEPHASVLRGGARVTVPADDLVPGDVVLLEAGDRVPADLRLLNARDLNIDESLLTGESEPTAKAPAPVAADAALGDRSAMAHSGTLVVRGIGQGVVTATGAATELGRIGELLRRVETLQTPLLRQMDRFGRQLTVLILALSALVFGVAVGLRGYGLADAFMAVVGLAVAAIPEGLPAVMTITLAIGTQRLAARRAIIRRLPAVETLGSVSVICSDKTGTLTQNEMTVATVATADATFQLSGVGYAPHGRLERDGQPVDAADHPAVPVLLRAALLCNDASVREAEGRWIIDGDPMEAALVVAAGKLGFDADRERQQRPRTDAIPFDSQHRFMASLHHDHDGAAELLVKGAPERVLAMCGHAHGAAGLVPLDQAAWDERVTAIAALGQRVLALAAKPMTGERRELTFADVDGELDLLGLVGLIDPPREEAADAVLACGRAGIDVKMITGDHAGTARAIARALGLPSPERTVTGAELDDLDERAFAEQANGASVFARTSPEHKLRLVSALQARGAVVAMTGDGVNDAPALKRADVGIAMGQKGSEAAKEAAEMVLADDHFATIVAAVREGRTVYDNLKKVIAWTLPTNGGEAMAIVAAIAFGVALPITPVQILWVNMITAVGLGLTLAFEPTEPKTMDGPPRPPAEALLAPVLLWRVAYVSLLFVAGVFAAYWTALAEGRSVEAARTLVVNALVVMEIAYLFSARYAHGLALTLQGLRGTTAVWAGVLFVAFAQLVFTYAPFMQATFQTRAPVASDALLLAGLGIALFAAVELEKALLRRWTRNRSRAS
ncbi:MAG: HAD-IC family P-type ATPase [Pseudomonadota bacterium]